MNLSEYFCVIGCRLTAIPSQRSVEISASVTVIPQLPEGRMGRGVSLYYLSMNLYTISSGGTTNEAMEESREVLSKSKISSSGSSSVICTILLVAYSSLFGKSSWRMMMMNASVAGFPLLTTRKSCPATTSPYNLSLCHLCSPLLADEGRGVQHPGNCWGFGPMDRSEVHGSRHSVLSIFAILRSMEWPMLDYQNSLVFMNETV